MTDLSPRREHILRAVVVEYVDTAEPVTSSLLVARYRLGVRTATVRRELAEMSAQGYLQQPHTSAGRIPSDAGYRYYVDRLATPEGAPAAERAVRKIAGGDRGPGELLDETCRLLARLTQYVSVLATHRQRSTWVRQVALTGLTAERTLMAVVLSTGLVESRVVESSVDLSPKDLRKVSELMTAAADGKRLRPLSKQSPPPAESVKPSARALMGRAWNALRTLCRSLSDGRLVTEGTLYLLGLPEFRRDMGTLAEILAALEDADVVRGMIERPAGAGPSVTIGDENEPDALKRLAVIADRFYVNDEEAGAIAVVGPTRMRYDRTIPIVRHAASALSDTLTRQAG
ncbi:MAG: heat-inducible transcription repressor HrcA [Armatimonadetes bacterium]|nr:heat-inducible transcription repressor HrcA [Armatimonadota bacterium]